MSSLTPTARVILGMLKLGVRIYEAGARTIYFARLPLKRLNH